MATVKGTKSVMFTARISEAQNEYLIDLGGGSRTKGFELLLAKATATRAVDNLETAVKATARRLGVSIPATSAKAPARVIGKRR